MITRAKDQIELLVASLTLILSTAGFLLGAYALGVIGLIGGGISLGILLGGRSPGANEECARPDSNRRPSA